MKTSMLGGSRRRELVRAWPELIARGVRDAAGEALAPGDLVSLPACIRRGKGGGRLVPGTVTGLAIAKDGVPSVVIHAPAWSGGRPDSWRSWIAHGDVCNKVDTGEAGFLAPGLGGMVPRDPGGPSGISDGLRAAVAEGWPRILVVGARTRAGAAIQPGDLVRLPRNVARNRGSQLHAAGTALGYAVGLDGSPCVVVDAVGEDVPELVRWRTWIVRGRDVVVIDTREAWRLEARYDHDGRLLPRR